MKIDDTDRKIIEELRTNSKQTTGKLSRKLNIPITTIHNRIKKIEKLGIIKNYTININYRKLGKPIFAQIGITVDYNAKKNLSQVDVAQDIKKIHGVEEVTIMTGGADILVKVIAIDIFDLNRIVTEELRNVVGVDKTQTSIVLKEV